MLPGRASASLKRWSSTPSEPMIRFFPAAGSVAVAMVTLPSTTLVIFLSFKSLIVTVVLGVGVGSGSG